MADRQLPPPAVLRQLLQYEPNTGRLFWKRRAGDSREVKRWNSRYAGQPAFTSSNKAGYHTGHVLGVSVRAHRLIWALVHDSWPSGLIDHIDGNPRNNRIANLRDVGHVENARNAKLRADNVSGIAGVGKFRGGKWHARVHASGRDIHLGIFDTKDEAAAARALAAADLGYHPNHGRR